MKTAPKVVLFSYHYLGSRRQAGFHWIADACWRLGCEVVFVTAPISRLSQIRRDFRFEYPVIAEANRRVVVRDRMSSYVFLTTYHPISLRRPSLDRLTAPVFRRYAGVRLGELEAIVSASGVVIMESTPAIMLVPQLRALSPGARLVYRVSDDLTFGALSTHPVVREAEERVVDQFDLISAASHITVDRLGAAGAVYHPHGIAKHLFDASSDSPYAPGVNVIWVGTKWLDERFLALASEFFPTWGFHIVGPVAPDVQRPNIHYYGELPFEKTVPYLKHADIGLSTFPALESAGRSREVMTITSLKTTQYTYCGLPVVSRHDLPIGRDDVFHYDVSDPATVRSALEGARAVGRRPSLGRDVWSWDDLTRTLLGC